MKKVILVGLVLALVLSVVPSMAETNSIANDNTPVTFQAMSHLSTVMPMTDTQLASVEGAAINIGLNIAVPVQINVCVLSPGCRLFNISNIFQRNQQ